jgi:glycosyltransferase involved in cell wall biosynthesis
MPRERIFRQYGAVDNAYFREHVAALRRQRKRGRDYFLACSRLIESRKNIARLLRAYAGYRAASTAAWDLVICGDGCDRGAYEELVARERMQGVEFAGFQQVDGLSAYLAGASCFVHAAVNEAWGLVVNEALASGLPVLVSRRCGCAQDLVHEGVNGFTFDPYDVDSLSALLQQMSQLPVPQRDAMGTASSQIVSRFGCEQFAAGLAEAMGVACQVRQGVGMLSRQDMPRVSGAEQADVCGADIGPLDQPEPADNFLAVH